MCYRCRRYCRKEVIDRKRRHGEYKKNIYPFGIRERKESEDSPFFSLILIYRVRKKGSLTYVSCNFYSYFLFLRLDSFSLSSCVCLVYKMCRVVKFRRRKGYVKRAIFIDLVIDDLFLAGKTKMRR